VYSVTSRQITLTQAIIMAGMLDPLGIPQRTEIIRRTDNNQQIFYHVDLAMVFAGKQPDIILKPYDEVMVGTNALTNFLSAMRTAFRATYGFGFVYDANYGVNQVTSSP
jgi:protein involved in polysaccharide export with SLBB domain